MSLKDLESENLETHVVLCAERYKNLEARLTDLDERMTKVEEHLVDIRDSMVARDSNFDRRVIAVGGTVIGAMFAAIIALLIQISTQ